MTRKLRTKAKIAKTKTIPLDHRLELRKQLPVVTGAQQLRLAVPHRNEQFRFRYSKTLGEIPENVDGHHWVIDCDDPDALSLRVSQRGDDARNRRARKLDAVVKGTKTADLCLFFSYQDDFIEDVRRGLDDPIRERHSAELEKRFVAPHSR